MARRKRCATTRRWSQPISASKTRKSPRSRQRSGCEYRTFPLVPAKAGTQSPAKKELDSRLRGNERERGGPMTTPLLAVRGVKTYYGKIVALKAVDVDVADGEIVTLIGANGAGKSTLMMTIFGNPRAREGSIVFDGRDITRLPTHEIARLRIAQAPEGRRIFARMTVLENLQMGAIVAGDTDFAKDCEKVFKLFPRLEQRLHQRGGTLSGGEQP